MKIHPRESDSSLMSAPRFDMAGPQAVGDRAEPSTFEQHFEAYWSSIFRVLERMLGDPDEAEDVALEVFYRLHQSHVQMDPNSNVRGWLYRVATNLGLHSLRSLRRRSRYEAAAGRYALEDAREDGPPDILAERERQSLVRAALSQMQSRQAQLLVLRYSGMAYKEIARVLDLSPASIGPLLLRAEREFEKLYRALAQEEP